MAGVEIAYHIGMGMQSGREHCFSLFFGHLGIPVDPHEAAQVQKRREAGRHTVVCRRLKASPAVNDLMQKLLDAETRQAALLTCHFPHDRIPLPA